MNEWRTDLTMIGLEGKPAYPLSTSSPTEAQPAADVVAMFLLGLLGFLFLCFIASAILMMRRSKNMTSEEPKSFGCHLQDPKLIPNTSPSELEPRQNWERDPDWWKKV